MQTCACKHIHNQPVFAPHRLLPMLPHIQNERALFRISLSFNRFSVLFLFYPSFLPFLSLRSAARENKTFSENEIRNIMFQVLSGLVFVHKHGKRLYSVSLYLFKSGMTFPVVLVFGCVRFHLVM